MDTNCEDCGGAGAEYLIDPYAHDMFGTQTLMWLCDDCHEDRCASV